MQAALEFAIQGNYDDGILDFALSRFFNWRQRKFLQIMSGNMCEICGEQLDQSFHADHVKAHVKGGWTVTQNGQALCAKCNQSKGAR